MSSNMQAENNMPFTEWLIKISLELGETLTVEEVTHVFMEHMRTFIPHQSIAVLAVDLNTNQLIIRNARNISYSFIKQFSRDLDNELHQQILNKHEHVVLNNLAPDDPRYSLLKLEHDFQSVCLVPIIQRQRVIGYLHCDRNTPPEFSDEERRQLQIVALLIGQQRERFELLNLSHSLNVIDEPSQALKYNAFIERYRMETARARTFQSSLTLILMVIDNYARFVATCGVNSGHMLLATVHGLIRECVREIDVVGRFAADQFIVCLSRMPAEKISQTLEQIRLAVQQKAGAQFNQSVTISAVAMTFEHQEELNAPLEKTLTALGSGLMNLRTKGKNQVLQIKPPRA